MFAKTATEYLFAHVLIIMYYIIYMYCKIDMVKSYAYACARDLYV